jgi:hypothetical protein
MPNVLSRLVGNRRGATTWGVPRPRTAALDAAAMAEIAEAAAADELDEYHAAVRRIIEQARGPW